MEGVRYVLLDIEGTICPISFVKETLFPYAIKALPDVLATKWDDPAFEPYRDAFPEDMRTSPEKLQAHVEDLTKRDVKIAYLKNLQGYLWEDGYRSGAYSTPLFPDVAPQLKKWKGEGIQLAIYSSGSVFAQKLLFQNVDFRNPTVGKKRSASEAANGEASEQTSEPAVKRTRVAHATPIPFSESALASSEAANSAAAEPGTQVEDMTALISGWFDTTNAGPKTEASSYNSIVAALKWPSAKTLFLSDSVKEIDAATEAGIKALLVDRPGNAAISALDKDRMDIVRSLAEVPMLGASQTSEPPAKADAIGEIEVSEQSVVNDEADAGQPHPTTRKVLGL